MIAERSGALQDSNGPLVEGLSHSRRITPMRVPVVEADADAPLEGRELSPRRLRIAFYSHDTMGLGHMRRNLLLAQLLASAEVRHDVLLIAGSRDINRFAFPAGVDCLSLPGLYKEEDGAYRSRHWDVPLSQLTALRSAAICGTLDAFAPDVLIVDNVPRGARGELNVVLAELRRAGRTRCVLGLRDILDAPETVRREWQAANNEEAIRDWYDAVWIYGEQAIYDSSAEYQFPPDIARKVRYTGYLDQRARLDGTAERPPDPLADLYDARARFALCVVGGGQDGGELAEAFAAAPMPPGMEGVIISGPMMPVATMERLHASERDSAGQLHVVPFHPEPTLAIQRADHVVSMGGYNSVCEILSFRKRALIVPRCRPRLEQLMRAQRMSELGLLDMLHPTCVTPSAIGAWLSQPASRLAPQCTLELDSAQRLAALLRDVLGVPTRQHGHPDLAIGRRRVG